MKLINSFLLILLTWYGFSQKEFDYDDYDWDETFVPEKYNSAIDHDHEATIVLERAIYAPDLLMTNNNFRSHRLIWIEKESAIEKINTLHFDGRIRNFKIRIIREDGEVISFMDDSEYSLSEKLDLDKIAIEGIQEKTWLEVFIEYQYYQSSLRFTLLRPFEVINAQFVLDCEANSKLRKGEIIRAFNGFESNENLSTSDAIVYEVKNVPAYQDLPYSHDYHETPRIDVNRNWDNTIKYAEERENRIKLDLGGFNRLRKIADEELGIKSATDREKFIAIEKYIKENITITKSGSQEVREIQKNQVADFYGTIIFYTAFFKAVNLDVVLLFTSDKSYIDLDPDFMMNESQTEIVFALPNEDLFILPFDKYYRAGRISNYCENMHALIIYDELNDDVGRVVKLPPGSDDYNTEVTRAYITIDDASNVATAKMNKIFFGETAIRLRGILHHSTEEEKNEVISKTVANGFEHFDISNSHLLKDHIDLNVESKDSLYFNADITSEEVISPIPNGYLINIPRFIGTQTSYFGDQDRTQKICIKNSKEYKHELVLEIPEGYEIDNIANHNFDTEYKTANGTLVASFKSEAKLVGNKLIITVEEFYKEGFYPAEDLQIFQRVVNSAYEFYNSQSRLLKTA